MRLEDEAVGRQIHEAVQLDFHLGAALAQQVEVFIGLNRQSILNA